MKRVVIGLACAGLLAGATMVTQRALARSSSVATMWNQGITNSKFCTKDGHITVVQAEQHDTYGSVSFGATYLSGTATYTLGNGNANVKPGCYDHTIVKTTVVGNGVAKSTIWYD